MELKLTENPFKVFTPEGLDAEDAKDLFVPVPDFHKIKDPGNTMLNGPRGCGKSMIFRYLLPDCQRLHLDADLHELEFLGVLISIKNTNPNLTELQRLDRQAAKIILNEHVLCMFVATRLFEGLAKLVTTGDSTADKAALEFFNDSLLSRLCAAGWFPKGPGLPADTPLSKTLERAGVICNEIYHSINNFAARLSFGGAAAATYEGPLCNYLSFLHPLLKDLRDLPFLPNGPVYLFIDDADYLNHTQTRILNSWISTRTQHRVSIKVSTQLRYKTFATIAGLPIQAPHDFQEINIEDIYTSPNSKYPKNLELILQKRFDKAGLQTTPKEMFPNDKAQEAAIYEIAQRIKEEWTQKGRGYRLSDDVVRYARPKYFKRLSGKAKSLHSYSYSGFDQLVHVSSRLVRYFLEPAAQMFDEERNRTAIDKPVLRISPATQNRVIRQSAETLMFTEFDRIALEDKEDSAADRPTRSANIHQRMIRQLQNLIRALGGTFHQKLISNDAERRVFSVAISGTPDPEVLEVFNLGVRYGYFHRSSIGNKDGTGRARLFVLTRRLAPHFNLDPSSFAGYLWTTTDLLRQGMADPYKVLRRIKKSGVGHYFESPQRSLFDG